VAARMHYHGFPVDEVRRAALALELRGLFRERAATVAALVKPYARVKILAEGEDGGKYKGRFRISLTGGVNENDLRALLFRECRRKGIKSFELEVPFSDHSRTDSGGASVDVNALLFLMIQDNTPPELKKIIYACWQCNSPGKALSTFIESNKVLGAIGPDGRMHAGINSDGTETGRWSCTDPNIFNLSEAKKDEDGALQGDLPNMRSMYVAERGCVIVHGDYRSFELEAMGDVTGDEPLRRMLKTASDAADKGIKGQDVHTQRAIDFFRLSPTDPVPSMIRRQGKVVGLASQYHAGLETVYVLCLRQIPDADYDDIAALWERFPQVHVGIAKHWQGSLHQAETLGYNETAVMNRRRYYPPYLELKDTETSNYRVQGTAADIANCTIIKLDAALAKYHPKAWLAMHCYDSFDVHCPAKEAASVSHLMEDIGRGPYDAGAGPRDWRMDMKVGPTWADV